MKKIIVLIGSILLIGMVLVFSQAPSEIINNDSGSGSQSTLEVYTPEVVIDAILTTDDEMGANPGNFLMQGGPSEIARYPQDMEVDDEGNIYIFDMANNRIQKFNSAGQYIESIPVKDCYVPNPDWEDYRRPVLNYKRKFTIDRNKEFYILDEKELVILELNKFGEELEKVKLPSLVGGKEIDYSAVELKLDKDNRAFFEAKDRDWRLLSIIRVNDSKVEVIKMDEKSRFLDGERYSVEEIDPKKWAKVTFWDAPKDHIKDLMVRLDEKRKWTLHLVVLGRDNRGNIYSILGLSNARVVVRKHDSKTGRLLAEFQIVPSVYSKSYIIKELMDQSGNFYQLQTYADDRKIRVVKWEVQDE